MESAGPMIRAIGREAAVAARKVEARNEQVVRIFRILHDLDRLGGVDLYELAERYSATTRTIRRDFDAIEAAGIPLVREGADDSARGRWRLDVDASARLTNLVEVSHFLALRLAIEESTALKRNSSLFALLEDLADRVEKALGRKGRTQLEEIERCFLSWEKFAWREAPAEVMLPLIDAIARRRLCVVRYQAPSSGNQQRRFRVLPLKLVVHHGAMYLHAWQTHFKAVILLNLQRLKELQVLDETGAVPEGYDPERLQNSAFGIFMGEKLERFELKFDARVRPYIEERLWHEHQTLTAEPDGGVRLTFTCTPSYEVTNWVASWQHHVEVLAPRRLRKELKDYGAWLTKQYEEG